MRVKSWVKQLLQLPAHREQDMVFDYWKLLLKQVGKLT